MKIKSNLMYYNLCGIVAGLAVFASVYFLFGNGNRDRTSIAEIDRVLSIVHFDDKIGLARFSAAKALDREIIAEWAYSIPTVCESKEIADIQSNKFLVAQKVGFLLVHNVKPKVERAIVENENYLRQICIDSAFKSNNKLLLTDKIGVYRKLESVGIKPESIAYNR